MIRRTLLAAISTAVAIAPCFAGPLDSRTPCTVAVKAFNSAKRPGQVLAGAPSPEVLEVGNYILSVMEGLDRQHTDIGEPGVWSNLSDAARQRRPCSPNTQQRPQPDKAVRDEIGEPALAHPPINIKPRPFAPPENPAGL
jgi:hypothetical protein